MTCDTCRKKKTCVELCPEAEEYVGQDNIPKDTWGRDVVYSLNYVSNMATTGIDLEEIEERKTQELLFYYQKINSMKDSVKKAILAMVYFGMPTRSIATILRTNHVDIWRIIHKK